MFGVFFFVSPFSNLPTNSNAGSPGNPNVQEADSVKATVKWVRNKNEGYKQWFGECCSNFVVVAIWRSFVFHRFCNGIAASNSAADKNNKEWIICG